VACSAGAQENDPGGTAPAAAGRATPDGEARAAQARSAKAEAEVPGQVVIDNFTFRPARLVVAAGTKVTWVNRDDLPHTATSSARPRLFDSGALDTDQKFSHVFTRAGTYDYFCTLHPRMTGKVIVK
jgi:plastocyanin